MKIIVIWLNSNFSAVPSYHTAFLANTSNEYEHNIPSMLYGIPVDLTRQDTLNSRVFVPHFSFSPVLSVITPRPSFNKAHVSMFHSNGSTIFVTGQLPSILLDSTTVHYMPPGTKNDWIISFATDGICIQRIYSLKLQAVEKGAASFLHS